MDDVGVEVRDVGRAGGEDGDAALERLGARREPRRSVDSQSTRRRVGDQPAVGVEVRRRGRGRGRRRARGGRPRPAGSRRRCRRRRRRRARGSAASRAPSATFETNAAPASPPPARRQPIVGTPQSAAISRWSEAAWRPARESATSSSTVGGASTSSGSAGRPGPSRRRRTSRSRASRRARCAGHRGLADALARSRSPRSTGSSNGSSCGGSKRKSAPTYGSPAASARDAQRKRSARPEHRLVGEVDDDLGAVEARRRAARRSRRRRAASRVPPTRIAPTHSYGSAAQRVAHDGRVVLAVDQRDRAHHRLAVTSRSIRPVYFSYSPVARSNWMIRSCPWNG